MSDKTIIKFDPNLIKKMAREINRAWNHMMTNAESEKLAKAAYKVVVMEQIKHRNEMDKIFNSIEKNNFPPQPQNQKQQQGGE